MVGQTAPARRLFGPRSRGQPRRRSQTAPDVFGVGKAALRTQ